MTALKKYIVWASPHMKIVVFAKDSREAKSKVWDDIKDGYTYGWDNWDDFNAGVKVESKEF